MAKKKQDFTHLFDESDITHSSNNSDLNAPLNESLASFDNSQDFSTLFEQSLRSSQRSIKVGDRLNAEILSIGKDESFVSTGTPQDAVLFNKDLLDENKNFKFKVGDRIDVVVIKKTDQEIRVSKEGSKKSSADTNMDNLEDAFDMELPVEGKVSEVVNGGFRVLILSQTAFCPLSQMDQKQITDPQSWIGKKLDFLITQYDVKQKNIVVSRRKLLDLQKLETEGSWLQKHKAGDLLQGTVTRLEQYGAFVDLGDGVEGLVHISEIGFVRIKHPSDEVKVGDSVQVRILKMTEEGSRLKISLSIKQASGMNEDVLKHQSQQPTSMGAFASAFAQANKNSQKNN